MDAGRTGLCPMVALVGVATLVAGACGGGEAASPLGSVVEVPGVFVEVSAGTRHSCGLRDDATIACWGDNTAGQLDAPVGR